MGSHIHKVVSSDGTSEHLRLSPQAKSKLKGVDLTELDRLAYVVY